MRFVKKLQPSNTGGQIVLETLTWLHRFRTQISGSKAANNSRYQLCILVFLILGVCWMAPFVQAEPSGRLTYSVNGFDEDLGRFDWNLYTTALSGTKNLRAIPLNHKGMYPSWGVDGKVLYFVQWDAGHSDIYSVRPDTPKNKTRITEISGTYRFLTASPDGKQLAFSGWTIEQVPQENQIWVLDTASGEMEAVTEVLHLGWPYSFHGISWAPSGKRLVFSIARPGWLEQLYLLDIETEEIEILTELNKDFYPVWAPDGKRILFLRWNREFDTFYTIDVETRVLEPLFNVDKATGYWSDWSPDGQYLVYSRWGTIYVYDTLTEETEELVEVEGSIFVIAWLREGSLSVKPREKLVTTWGKIKSTVSQR